MIRLLLPSILEFAFFLITLWIVYMLIMKYVKLDDPTKNPIRSIFLIITIASSLCFVFYTINIASVNEIPRNSPDRSAQKEGIKNFEERLINDTTNKNK